MALLLKNNINQIFITQLADSLEENRALFDRKIFKKMTGNKELEQRELKERWQLVVAAFKASLSPDYLLALKDLLKIAPSFLGLQGFVFPLFVEMYGLADSKHFDQSLDALQLLTQYSSGEFAIRFFYKKNSQKTYQKMMQWSTDKNHHLRRLASEGMRPRLPWAIKIPEFIENPRPNLVILEKLKADNHLYVKKSVANHLHDIGKDHPDLLLKLAQQWWGTNENTNWIVKHALRTLLKNGNKQALQIVGIREVPVNASLDIAAIKIKLHQDLIYFIKLNPKKRNTEIKMRLDLILIYPRKNGSFGKKIFKIAEKEINSSYQAKKILSFRPMTTRKHSRGEHCLQLVVNGKILDQKKFKVL